MISESRAKWVAAPENRNSQAAIPSIAIRLAIFQPIERITEMKPGY